MNLLCTYRMMVCTEYITFLVGMHDMDFITIEMEFIIREWTLQEFHRKY